MDRLTLEKIEEKQVAKQEEASQVVVNSPPPTNSYVNSFEGHTIADIKREKEEKEHQEFLAEKETLIQEQFLESKQEEKQDKEQVEQKVQEKSVNIIEKPNYDLIEEPKRILRLKRKQVPKNKNKDSKLKTIVLACALAICAVVCIANFTILDNMTNNIANLEQTYNLKLDKYVRDIINLDTTKKSMEFVETYPDELLDAGDLGQKSNWFDRLCNFFGGFFGG